MARGSKTGGRDFTPGHGRPKGAKDKQTRASRKCIREMLENVLKKHGVQVESAIEKKLKKGDPAVLRLLADYLDGKPVQEFAMRVPGAVYILLSDGPGS